MYYALYNLATLLLVMSFPADGIEAAYKNNIDDVRNYLDSKHTNNYVVVNVSQRSYRTDKLNDRVNLNTLKIVTFLNF